MDWKMDYRRLEMSDIKDAYPVRICEFEENDGLVTVLFYKQKLNWLDRTIFKRWAQKPMKIDLDNIGSFVWNLCDGKHSVFEIAELLKKEMGEDFEKPNERVELFIKQMYKNKLINLFKKEE